MAKLRIAVDADNTINNHMDKNIEMYNDRYGASLTKDMFTEYDICKSVPFEEAEKFKAMFLEKELWDSLTPIEDSQWGVQKLINNGFEVFVATATHHTNFPYKVEWFKKYFPFLDAQNIICIQDKSILDVDFIVDDCIEQLQNTKWAHRIVFDQPWNRNVWDDAHSLHRAYTWQEAVNIIMSIAKEEDNY